NSFAAPWENQNPILQLTSLTDSTSFSFLSPVRYLTLTNAPRLFAPNLRIILQPANQYPVMRPAVIRPTSDETPQPWSWFCYGYLLWAVLAVQVVTAVTGDTSPSLLSPGRRLSWRFNLMALRASREAQRHPRVRFGMLRKYNPFPKQSFVGKSKHHAVEQQQSDESHHQDRPACARKDHHGYKLPFPSKKTMLEENCSDLPSSSSHGRRVKMEMMAPNSDIMSPLGEGWYSSSMFAAETEQVLTRGPICVIPNIPAVTPKRKPFKASIVTNATLSSEGLMSSEGGTAQAGFVCYDLSAVVAERPCLAKGTTCGPLLTGLTCDPRDLRAARRRAEQPNLCAIDLCADFTIPRDWRDYRAIC
ncbi:hypothetical protein L249_2054, partial [Ophiocordyceps polyrhachis-furcata BCC 54312]